MPKTHSPDNALTEAAVIWLFDLRITLQRRCRHLQRHHPELRCELDEIMTVIFERYREVVVPRIQVVPADDEPDSSDGPAVA